MARDLPLVGEIGIELREAEETGGIVLGLAIGTELTEQGIRHGIARGLIVAGGIEGDATRERGTTVGVFAVSREQRSGFDGMAAMHPGEAVGSGKVGGRRDVI